MSEITYFLILIHIKPPIYISGWLFLLTYMNIHSIIFNEETGLSEMKNGVLR